MTNQGQKLSKRQASNFIQDIQHNVFGHSVTNFLYCIGYDKIVSKSNIKEMIQDFDLNRYTASPVGYDISSLMRINKQMLINSNIQDISDALKNINCDFDLDDQTWNLIKENIECFNDIIIWKDIIKTAPQIDNSLDKDYISLVLHLLENIDELQPEIWPLLYQMIHEKTQKKGKDVILPIRLALTGRIDGPAMKDLIKVLPIQEIKYRLSLVSQKS